MTRKSALWMRRIAEQGCILCDHLGTPGTPAEVHHILDTASRSDYLTIPLCPEHHRGPTGFHGMGQRAFERTYKVTEAGLLAMTLEKLA